MGTFGNKTPSIVSRAFCLASSSVRVQHGRRRAGVPQKRLNDGHSHSGVQGVHLRRFEGLLEGALVFPGHEPVPGYFHAVGKRKGIQLLGLDDFADSFLRSARGGEMIGVAMVRSGIVWAQFQGPLVSLFSSGLVPVIHLFDAGQGKVRVGQSIIQLQSLWVHVSNRRTPPDLHA